jgi:hypothetical protein
VWEYLGRLASGLWRHKVSLAAFDGVVEEIHYKWVKAYASPMSKSMSCVVAMTGH